eukprot:scaffold890_cov59-Cylindrotheca_fusiformis.AAC.1
MPPNELYNNNNQDDSESCCSSILSEADEAYDAVSKQQQQQHSVVRFAPLVACRTTISRYEYTMEEARNTWIFANEKSNAMKRHSKDAQRMKLGKKARKNSTYRGLETLDSTDVQRMVELINACVHAVLDEQDRQWKKDIFLWNNFAKISRSHSKGSKKMAAKRAKLDEREAKKAYRSMDNNDETTDSGTSTDSSSAHTSDVHLLLPTTLKSGMSNFRSNNNSSDVTTKLEVPIAERVAV